MNIINKFKVLKKQENQSYRKVLQSFINEISQSSFDENLPIVLNQQIISLDELKTTLIYLMFFKETTVLGQETLNQIESLLANHNDSNIRKILIQSISPNDLNVIPFNYTHSFEKISLRFKIFKKVFPLKSDYNNDFLIIAIEEKIKKCLTQKITIELIYYILGLIDLFEIDPINLYKLISFKIIKFHYNLNDVNISKLKKDYPIFLNTLKIVLENTSNKNNENDLKLFLMPELKEIEKTLLLIY